MAAGQVHRDRVGSRVDPQIEQLLAQLDDLVFQSDRDLMWVAPRSAGASLQASLALLVEPPDELVDPPGRDPEVPRYLRLRSTFDPNRRDDQPCQRHRPPLRSGVGTMT